MRHSKHFETINNRIQIPTQIKQQFRNSVKCFTLVILKLSEIDAVMSETHLVPFGVLVSG